MHHNYIGGGYATHVRPLKHFLFFYVPTYQGMDEKDATNLAVDKQTNADLRKLLSLGGPFAKSDDVDRYMMVTDINDEGKNDRMYTEVRYARNTSVTFPKVSDIFRLKKNYKNLDTSVYGANLKVYLDKVSCKVNMCYTDFKAALQKLSKVFKN